MGFAQNLLGIVDDYVLLLLLAALPVAFLLGLKRRKRRRYLVADGDEPFAATTAESMHPDELPVEREDPDLVERVAVSRHIADLMLADEWTEIAREMAEWEEKLESATGGARYHDVAADVALSGLQHLIDQAPHKAIEDLDDAEIEISYFDETYQANPDNHILAALAARAHLALGAACRAELWPNDLRQDAWRRMAHHYVEAGDILKGFEPLAYMSPLLAEAHYLHALGSPGGTQHLPELFDAWIELDPANPCIYECHAEWLADPANVSDDDILHLADQAMMRTENTFGTGGYALFFLPLLERRDGARALLDRDLFATAMLDLASTDASQAEINQTANALAAEMRIADTDCTALNDTLYVLIRWHLEVIYPRLWSLSEASIQALVRDAAEAVPDSGPIDDLFSKAA